MKKPTLPQKPWPPTLPYWYQDRTQRIRKILGPLDDGDGYNDEPSYPIVTLDTILDFAKEHEVDPKLVEVSLDPRAHHIDLEIGVYKPVTKEMNAEADKEHAAAMKEYNEVTLPAYEAAKAKYDADLRSYYKWKHDNV